MAGTVVRVSWVDAGVTELEVSVGPDVDFVDRLTGVTINAQASKWCPSGDDKPVVVAVRVRRERIAVVLENAKPAVRVRRD